MITGPCKAFHDLDLGFGERVVVRDLRATERSCDTEPLPSCCAVQLLVMGEPRSEANVTMSGEKPCLVFESIALAWVWRL